MGWLALALFVAFNLVCLRFFLATRQISLDQVQNAGSPGSRTVAEAIGRATETVEIGIWLLGDAVLGLAVFMTRGRSPRPSPLPPAPGRRSDPVA